MSAKTFQGISGLFEPPITAKAVLIITRSDGREISVSFKGDEDYVLRAVQGEIDSIVSSWPSSLTP